MSARSVALFCLLFTSPLSLFADEAFRCGTGPETDRRVRAVRDFVARNDRFAKVEATSAPATVRDGIFYMEANQAAAPFYDPFDLEGSSIRFSRVDVSTYSAQKIALAYEEDAGTVLKRFRAGNGNWHYITYRLQNFTLPFFDRDVTTVYVSAFQGIFLEPPTTSTLDQLGPADAIADRTPAIAALLLTEQTPLRFVEPTVWVRETSDAVIFTWRVGVAPEVKLDVQAKLAKSGEITFSYKRVAEQSWGAVIVTSGTEPWRSGNTPLGSGDDAAGDVHASFSALIRAMLDVRNVEIVRKGNLDMLEVRIRVGANIDAKAAASGDALQYFVAFEPDTRTLFSRGVIYEIPVDEDPHYYVGGLGGGASPAAHVEGDTVVLQFLDSSVSLETNQQIYVYTSAWSNENFGDRAEFTATIPPPAGRAELDLSTLASPMTGSRPLVETFTLPVLSPYDVWEQLKAQQPGLSDNDVDGIAIYQSFYTDIIFYAGAYSTSGNPGVDGIAPPSPYRGSNVPREPALLHMNRFDYGYNETLNRSAHVSLHEFGHRWLFFVQLNENGENSRVLNPLSAHPAQYVHTPAAFPVYSDKDSSVMGGGWFTDAGAGNFQSGDSSAYGYSWLDLYLMGLAAPEEVPPYFYISDSGLGGAYYPPANYAVTGERHDFTVGQVIAGTGARYPTTATAQRSFRVYFVLLTNPGQLLSDEDIQRMEDHRAMFVQNFKRATNQRGDVITSYVAPESGPRRRPARR
ncbi:MAG: hypothetical protein ACYC7A_04535 [Thermoanaerobaculia bacterium]